MKKIIFFKLGVIILLFLACAKPSGQNNSEIDIIQNDTREIVISDEIKSEVLSETIEYEGILFQADSTIAFTSDGKVRFGFLAEDTWINGEFYPEGSFVEFTHNEEEVIH